MTWTPSSGAGVVEGAMGLEVVVARRGPCPLAPLISTLQHSGMTIVLAMVDDNLLMPGTPPPDSWREARLRTQAGTVTLRWVDGGIAVLVFGNADAALRGVQARIAAALKV